jgi:4-hydroxy-tetrahydrodipicolinate synthase
LLRQAREHVFTLLVGHDSIFTRARMAGADGIVSGVACAVPELLLALDRAIQEQAAAEIERLDGRLQEFVQRIERFPTPLGIKAALAERGIKTGHLATPLGRETRAALDEFREWFRGWLKSL